MACQGATCVMVHKQQPACTICGKNMKCGDSKKELQKNYQKQVDPPAASYKQILPDHRWDDDKEKGDKKECEKPQAIQICICPPQQEMKKKEKTDCQKQEDKKEEKKEEKGVLSSAAMKVNRLLLFVLASCLPMGGGGGQCPPPVKMMLCLPCPPPCPEGQGHSSGAKSCGKSSKKPRDYTYRCESRELRGGNLYTCCQCNKRNGLQHDCPRTPCQGRPACLQKPWPDCWPSGGCHGIDYSRETGTKRYDPCREQRFDNKQCSPPSSKAAKSECGGNMMVVVCPQSGR